MENYLGLFFSAFTSATILPGSSEIVFAFMLKDKSLSISLLLLVATTANTFGGMTGYYLGKFSKYLILEKYFKIKKEKIEYSLKYVKKYNVFIALLCWLPIVGDFICVALGVAKTNVLPTLVFMLIGKFFRYVSIYYLLG